MHSLSSTKCSKWLQVHNHSRQCRGTDVRERANVFFKSSPEVRKFAENAPKCMLNRWREWWQMYCTVNHTSTWPRPSHFRAWWRNVLSVALILALPTYQVAEGFARPAAPASFSLRFTVPLSAAEHFRLLALGYGTACYRRSRWHHLWHPSALDSRRFCLLSHILTFGSSDIFVYTLSIVDLAVF